jgi:hypothetical protein
MYEGRYPLKRTASRLADLVKNAKKEAESGGSLSADTLLVLRVWMARLEQAQILASEYSPHAALRAATKLIERYDHDFLARSARMKEIDRLTNLCDQIFDKGLDPEPVYLRALAHAVMTFEADHSCGNDDHIVGPAWDILAEAEAGRGAVLELVHYERAHARHLRSFMSLPDNVVELPQRETATSETNEAPIALNAREWIQLVE